MMKWKYEVGQRVERPMSTLEIVDRYKNPNKRYKCKCLKCGYINDKEEYDIERTNCSVCNKHKTVKGINDIATKRPDLLGYFINKEEAYTHSQFSNKKTRLCCPTCKTEKTMTFNKLSNFGFGCPICSSGGSIPERIMTEFLRESGVEFEREKVFDWCRPKRYDFYLEKYNTIIETHGLQHYKDTTMSTLKEQTINDELKYEKAKENGIENYFVVDCRKTDFNFIVKSIKSSGILELLNINFNSLDLFLIRKRAYESIIQKSVDLWNNGIKNTVEIGKLLNLSRVTVSKNLKTGCELGLCDYDTKKIMANSGRSIGVKSRGEFNRQGKCVKIIETDETFITVSELSRQSLDKFGTYLIPQNISMVCRGERKQYKGFHFEYV